VPSLPSIPRVDDEKTDRAIQALAQRVAALTGDPVTGGVIVEGLKVREELALRVQHGLGRKARGVVVLKSDVGNVTAQVRSSDVNTAQVSLTSDWEAVDYHEVKTDGTGWTFSGLDGDTDGEYLFEGYAEYDMSLFSNNIILKPNSTLDANMYTNWHAINGGTYTDGSTNALILVSAIVNAAAHAHFRCTLAAATGVGSARMGIGHQTSGHSPASNVHHAGHGLNWRDTTTPIKSIDIFSEGGAGSLKAGTTCRLSRRPKLVDRTLDLWVF
jgi:hypothetical protein